MRITFVGFGEAAQAMAGGLAEEAAEVRLSAFDLRFGNETQSRSLREQAAALGVRACAGLPEAIEGADIVLSLVVGSAAVGVGEQAGALMTPDQIFIDLNSISPDGKRAVGEALASGCEAGFVEGAVMARVPPHRHRVPILLAGEPAERAASLLGPLGMEIEVVGTRIGQACAVKMIRSIFVKGVEALLLESLTAAEKAGVRERILDSVSGTFPGIDWRETATYYIGRTQQHGKRRVTEMTEAAATLEGLGVTPVLSRAIAETIGAAHRTFAASGLPADRPYDEMLAVLAGAEGSEKAAQ